MNSVSEIRQQFLEFFQSKQHTLVASSSLVPGNDPTLLFTNAGMVPFKDVFLGAEKRSYTRATSSQRCVRAGGKHNDLDAVGYTARHHTFFEMLGNFSFGDYFKHEAISYAWELLTEVYRLPKDKLWVTVYHTDNEAYDLWANTVGVPPERIVRISDNKGAPYASDNFWQMADTGPCGPCTEIFYDHGADVAGGPPGSPNEDGDRYIEIWNIVFMQFDRGSDGQLAPLPAPCVDTGMGLERLAAVLQHVHSNYEIDLFQKLIQSAAQLTQTKDITEKSLRVIADHIRACAFLIVDGVLPSNEGRGYVLRRIIRRALRHGWKLGVRDLFFYRMVPMLVAEMGTAYPELEQKQTLVEQVLHVEEERFAETLDQGMRIFDEVLLHTKNKTIAGEDAFRLYDTFGFPVDLTADIAREHGANVDMKGFENAMQAQRMRARSASQFVNKVALPADLTKTLTPTVFQGYDTLETANNQILALLVDGKSVDSVNAGTAATVILDRTPFYAESGGQVGDCGIFLLQNNTFEVHDTQKIAGTFYAHQGIVKTGVWRRGDVVTAQVDSQKRQATRLNHSATHLLHAALRQLLGDHVQQKGSLVAHDRLRFDFSHFQAVTQNELQRIEQLVNTQIRQDHATDIHEMAYDQAIASGAVALFGEKYGEHVRVLRMGDFSTELCGGTHVTRTGEIGCFKIISESGVAAGVRRIEALTGESALNWINQQLDLLSQTAQVLSVTPEQIQQKISQLIEHQQLLTQDLTRLQSQQYRASIDALLNNASVKHGISILSTRLQLADTKLMREAMDYAKQICPDSVIIFATAQDNRVNLVAGVSGKAQSFFKAGDLIKQITQAIDGKGGGKPDFAQGGGMDSPKLDCVLKDIVQQLEDYITHI